MIASESESGSMSVNATVGESASSWLPGHRVDLTEERYKKPWFAAGRVREPAGLRGLLSDGDQQGADCGSGTR